MMRKPAGAGTREWVVNRSPYLLAYRIEPDNLEVLAAATQSVNAYLHRLRKFFLGQSYEFSQRSNVFARLEMSLYHFLSKACGNRTFELFIC